MDVFTAFAEPRRREILDWLSRGERSAGDIARRFEMSGPAASQHLRVLRRHGLVRVRPEGQRRIYRLDPTGLDPVLTWVEDVRREWNQSLDQLQDALAADFGPEEAPHAGERS